MKLLNKNILKMHNKDQREYKKLRKNKNNLHNKNKAQIMRMMRKISLNKKINIMIKDKVESKNTFN